MFYPNEQIIAEEYLMEEEIKVDPVELTFKDKVINFITELFFPHDEIESIANDLEDINKRYPVK